MSVIRKIPYIETVLSELTANELEDLKYILDNGGSNVAATFGNIPDDNISAVYFDLQDDKPHKTGILIKNSFRDCLVSYSKFQDLVIYDLDLENNTFAIVKEVCSIEELRRILGDYISTRHDDDIDRVTATDLAYDTNGFKLMHDGVEIDGQTNKVKLKTINGLSLVGSGDLSTNGFYALTTHAIASNGKYYDYL